MKQAPANLLDARALIAAVVLGTVGDLPAIDQVIGAHATHWRVERLAVLDPQKRFEVMRSEGIVADYILGLFQWQAVKTWEVMTTNEGLEEAPPPVAVPELTWQTQQT